MDLSASVRLVAILISFPLTAMPRAPPRGKRSGLYLFLFLQMNDTVDTLPVRRPHGKASEVAEKVLEAFREPSRLPAALAPVFIRRKDSIPCNAWSWGNRLIVALHDHSDARGFRQWQQVNRFVREGERAVYILAPITRRIEKDDDEQLVTVGFKAMPVFGLEQTGGEPLSTGDPALDALAGDSSLARSRRRLGHRHRYVQRS